MKGIKLFIILLLLSTSCENWESEDAIATYKIGVMMPFTGEYASEWNNTLDWAVENINMVGGVNGHNIELIKKDIAIDDVITCSENFINDDEIKAVIGPFTSSEVNKAAPLFISGRKPLIAPAATSSYISRAYAGKKYFWRMVESDISQTQTLMLLAQTGGAERVSLITDETAYGASFEDWFGYFAQEMGIEVASIEVMPNEGDLDYSTVYASTSENKPDAVIISVSAPEKAAQIARQFNLNNNTTRLLFSDAACLPSFIENLGDMANNLEGLALSSDPTSGFDISYKVRYGHYPEAYMANLYDAVMLIALALESAQGEVQNILAENLMQIVDGKGTPCGWRRDELATAISNISLGDYPTISGASGNLDYDELYYTDVISSTYGHWRVDAGNFVTIDFFTTSGNGRISSTSAAYRMIASERQDFSGVNSWPTVGEKNDNYAFLMAVSNGWENYRHQADVLNNYQLLKRNGFDDEHIILILEDDLAYNDKNSLQGVIRNEVGGENLYTDVNIDYLLNEIDSSMLSKILTGEITANTPIVLEAGKNDNVFFFTSGHGCPDGVVLQGKELQILGADYWHTIFETLKKKEGFRQLFWSVESCYSGAIGEKINTPGVMLLTGANPNETSKANFYDSEIKTWLSDKFAYAINNTISDSPDIPFDELYENCYKYVNGSHVSFYNYENFGNIYDITLDEFTSR